MISPVFPSLVSTVLRSRSWLKNRYSFSFSSIPSLLADVYSFYVDRRNIVHKVGLKWSDVGNDVKVEIVKDTPMKDTLNSLLQKEFESAENQRHFYTRYM